MDEIHVVIWNIVGSCGKKASGILSLHKTQDGAIAAAERYNSTAEDDLDYASHEIWEVKQ